MSVYNSRISGWPQDFRMSCRIVGGDSNNDINISRFYLEHYVCSQRGCRVTLLHENFLILSGERRRIYARNHYAPQSQSIVEFNVASRNMEIPRSTFTL